MDGERTGGIDHDSALVGESVQDLLQSQQVAPNEVSEDSCKGQGHRESIGNASAGVHVT